MLCFSSLSILKNVLNQIPGVRYRVDPLWLLGGLPVIHFCINLLHLLRENITQSSHYCSHDITLYYYLLLNKLLYQFTFNSWMRKDWWIIELLNYWVLFVNAHGGKNLNWKKHMIIQKCSQTSFVGGTCHCTITIWWCMTNLCKVA